MWEREKKRTHKEWSAYLLEGDPKLTRAEFDSHELAVIHVLLERIHAGLGLDHLNENGTGGHFEVLRNLLDRFVGVVLKHPPAPANGHAPMGAPTNTPVQGGERANMRLLPNTETTEEGR